MKLTYITNHRLPTVKAHGYQIVKMCEELARNGCEIELVYQGEKHGEELVKYYQIGKIFPLYALNLPKWPSLMRLSEKLGFFLKSLIFCLRMLFLRIERGRLIYARNAELAFVMKLRGFTTIFEIHDWPRNHSGLFLRLIKGSDKIIAISQGLRRKLLENGLPEDRILVSPDGVDNDILSATASREEARKRLGLPQDQKIILYAGHLYGWKGADTLLECAPMLSIGAKIYIVGGYPADIAGLKKRIITENIELVGLKPRSEIPMWLKAADVLVLPNSAKYDISKLYTSPLKMFEYMASRRPIIASDLPSIREILDEENANFFTADDPGSLAQKLNQVLADPASAQEKAEQAFLDVQKFTWEQRAKNIIEFIK